MKQIRLTLLTALLTLLGVGAAAKPVDPAMARRVAANLLGDTLLVDRTAELPFQGLYLFTPASGRGFAVVAGDNCALPVVGYSASNPFSLSAKAPMAWLASVASRIDALQREGIESTPEVDARWQQALAGGPKDGDAVAPLVATQWGQSPYYNDLCPFDVDYQAHALTGCGATAMAQVMKYWNCPDTGYWAESYYHHTYGQLHADFGNTVYDWAHMPVQLTAASSDTERLAVATLMYHCGVALNMNYSCTSSNSYIYYDNYNYGRSTESVMPLFFNYSGDIRSVLQCEYPNGQWEALLRAQLDAGRPVIYRGGDPYGGGHIFVCDGYDAQGLFHINWGWDGYADGYFAMGALNPDEYSSWNLGNSAIINIYPRTGAREATVTVTGVANRSDWGSVSYRQGAEIFGGQPFALEATAATGYRFVRWSDGSLHNPRYRPAVESHTDTAIFEPIHRDTISFCQPRLYFSYGWGYETGQPTEWGICIPTQLLPSDGHITSVKLYVDEDPDAQRRVSIYSGGDTGPDSLIYQQDSYLNGHQGWTTIVLDSMVAYNPQQPVWVVLSTNGVNYPAACSRYGGVPGGTWFRGSNGRWFTVTDGYYVSWLMKVNIASSHSGIADVADDGTFRVRVDGRTVTVDAATDDIALYDIQGRLIHHSSFITHHSSFTLPASGVYLVRAGDRIKKIVVQ